jgi:copper transport protein
VQTARKKRLTISIWIVAVVVWLVFVPAALAHANLVRSEPASNSAQKTSPPQVRVWFSENIEPGFSTVRVLDRSGAQVDKGDGRGMVDDPKGFQVSVPDLPIGLYTVVWNVLSADDGHTTSGSYVFSVGDVPLSESSPRDVISLVDSALSASQPPGLFQIAVRWFNLLTLIILTGSLTFPLFVLLPAVQLIQTAREQLPPAALARARANWARRFWWWLVVAVILCSIATVGLLVMQTLAAGGLSSAGRVLFGTRFGNIWWLRVAVLTALGILIFRSRTPWATGVPRDGRLLVANALSLTVLVTQSLNSHGAAVETPPLIALVVDFIHLLGSSIWLGGLFQLVFTLPAFIGSLDQSQRRRVVAIIVGRFSWVAFLVVGVIVVSGIYAMVVQVGSVEALFATLYGDSLVIKLVLIGIMLAIAAFNLIVVRPALARDTVQRSLAMMRYFRGATALEVLIGIAVILAVGLMTSVAPAHSAYDPSPKAVVLT